jgi:hypothetical protein
VDEQRRLDAAIAVAPQPYRLIVVFVLLVIVLFILVRRYRAAGLLAGSLQGQ